MIRIIALVGVAAVAGFGVRAGESAAAMAKTVRVMVHCPNGNQAGFVTPQRVKVAVGDTVEWRMTGQVLSDVIVISLKDAQEVWPFDGDPSRGTDVARASTAKSPGTYGYNVRLLCRIPEVGAREVIIDPDIIIE